MDPNTSWGPQNMASPCQPLIPPLQNRVLVDFSRIMSDMKGFPACVANKPSLHVTSKASKVCREKTPRIWTWFEAKVILEMSFYGEVAPYRKISRLRENTNATAFSHFWYSAVFSLSFSKPFLTAEKKHHQRVWFINLDNGLWLWLQ